MAKQTAKDRAQRLTKGCCPIHGLAMTQVGNTVVENKHLFVADVELLNRLRIHPDYSSFDGVPAGFRIMRFELHDLSRERIAAARKRSARTPCSCE